VTGSVVAYCNPSEERVVLPVRCTVFVVEWRGKVGKMSGGHFEVALVALVETQPVEVVKLMATAQLSVVLLAEEQGIRCSSVVCCSHVHWGD
jgi:hypothetical protein